MITSTSDERLHRARAIVELYEHTTDFDSDSYAAIADDAYGLALRVVAAETQ